MFSNLKRLLNKTDTSGERRRLRTAFSKIKEELAEHLDSINDNTNEIQSNYEYLCEIDSKVQKLEEKMEEVLMFLRQSGGEVSLSAPEMPDKIRLTQSEQQVFLIMHNLGATQPLCYRDIAAILSIQEHLVRAYVGSITSKGVPVIKKYNHDGVRLSIDDDFRELQTKMNVLGISEDVNRKVAALVAY